VHSQRGAIRGDQRVDGLPLGIGVALPCLLLLTPLFSAPHTTARVYIRLSGESGHLRENPSEMEIPSCTADSSSTFELVSCLKRAVMN
jgi:hypothetical protein